MTSSSHHPYFSVVTPSYQQGDFIGDCLQSVLDQQDSDYEHLVFDNESKDRTREVVAGFPGVSFVSEPDRGQAHAVNKGMAASRGEIICWINADDAYPPGVFERLRKIFADPAVKVVYGDARQITYDGRGEVPAPASFASRLDLVRWWSPSVKLHQPAVFFRREVYESCGPLREDLHYALDYEYWWRVSEHYEFVRCAEVLAIQHRQPDSKTVLAWERVLQEREIIFSPHYELLKPVTLADLEREKRFSLAELYLKSAYSLAASDPSQALQLLGKAWAQRPAMIPSAASAGLIRRSLAGFCKRETGRPSGPAN